MPNAKYSVVVTRPKNKSGALSAGLRAAGFTVLEIPLLDLKLRPPDAAGRAQLAKLSRGDFNWIVLSSAAAAGFLREVLPGEIPGLTRIAVQGRATAAEFSSCFGRKPDLLPELSTAEGMLRALPADLSGQKVLLPSALSTRDILAPGLQQRGASVDVLPLYETVFLQPEPKMEEELRAVKPAQLMFTFFSPSAVRSAHQSLGSYLRLGRNISIGPVTTAALTALGYAVFAEAAEQDHAQVVRELTELCRF